VNLINVIAWGNESRQNAELTTADQIFNPSILENAAAGTAAGTTVESLIASGGCA
jgi:hypothetical protein